MSKLEKNTFDYTESSTVGQNKDAGRSRKKK
jgi:hypothetical protein